MKSANGCLHPYVITKTLNGTWCSYTWSNPSVRSLTFMLVSFLAKSSVKRWINVSQTCRERVFMWWEELKTWFWIQEKRMVMFFFDILRKKFFPPFFVFWRVKKQLTRIWLCVYQVQMIHTFVTLIVVEFHLSASHDLSPPDWRVRSAKKFWYLLWTTYISTKQYVKRHAKRHIKRHSKRN